MPPVVETEANKWLDTINRKASSHPLFRVVSEMFSEYLDRRRPYVFWIEEVNTFGSEGPNAEEAPVTILMSLRLKGVRLPGVLGE